MQKVTLLLLLLSVMIVPGFAAEPKLKSLLVSIEKYEIAPLDYAENDIGNLATTLMSRYDCQAQACIDSAASDGKTGVDVPMKSIMEKIKSWCEALKEEDTAILYLAGHGVKDESGRLYLAMTNFDRKNFETAAIPFEWIRDQFGNSQASNKLILLDTCFAGTGKSIDFEQANTNEISESFAKQENVTTIASSSGEQQSWLWGEAKHSLFTYWLIEGLKGHADFDNDRVITCEEIAQYLQDNVSWVAEASLEKKQNPIVLNENAGKDIQLPLRAIALTRLIDDVAEQIDLQMRVEKFKQVGIPEFTTGMDNTFQPEYGLLPRWIAESLRETLGRKARKNKSNYEILTDNAMREVLKSKGLTPDDLGTEKTTNLKVGGEPLPLLVVGKVNMFSETGLSMRANLLDTARKHEVGYAGGTALLNKSDIAMTGVSAKFQVVNPSQPNKPTTYVEEPLLGLVPQNQQQETQQMLGQPHPLANKDNPFKVTVEVRRVGTGRYVKRDFVFDGENCYLPLNKGEEYQIRFNNASGKDIFVRLLVDGLNSLSQSMDTKAKGAYVEALDVEGEDVQGEMTFAPRVALDEARAWFVDANKEIWFQGFYDANGKSDSMGRFQIVDADQSIAARKNYTEQLGLITIAFYGPAPKKRGIGTYTTPQERIQLKYYQGNQQPGEMLAVFNIRYMTPEALKSVRSLSDKNNK